MFFCTQYPAPSVDIQHSRLILQSHIVCQYTGWCKKKANNSLNCINNRPISRFLSLAVNFLTTWSLKISSEIKPCIRQTIAWNLCYKKLTLTPQVVADCFAPPCTHVTLLYLIWKCVHVIGQNHVTWRSLNLATSPMRQYEYASTVCQYCLHCM